MTLQAQGGCSSPLTMGLGFRAYIYRVKAFCRECAASSGHPDLPVDIDILNCWQEVASQATRRLVLEEGYRVDGRGVTDVRPIWSRAGCLPRVHGSALFTRGETQALAVTTLGELHLAGCTFCPDLESFCGKSTTSDMQLRLLATDCLPHDCR